MFYLTSKFHGNRVNTFGFMEGGGGGGSFTGPGTPKSPGGIGLRKVFRDKQCFNTQFAYMSSVFSPDRQASLMPLSLNNNCPSKAPF